MRRGLAWSAAVVASVAVALALVSATAAARPETQPGLITGPKARSTRSAAADAAWLSLGTVPGRGTRWAEMTRTALLDLHTLAGLDGAITAGPGGPWKYAWPRDMAFVAVALARTGHHREAVQALTFLQDVQLGDGGFEARYLLDGSGPPDDRARQSDGAGWVLWAAAEVGRSSGGGSIPAGLRRLVDKATDFALAVTSNGRHLPPPSPDYWEVGVARTSLGTVAPLLAGLQASQDMYAGLDDDALAERSKVAAGRLRTVMVERFASDWQRFGAGGLGDDGGLDAAVTFLMPPFAQSPTPSVLAAWTRYQVEARRPAGGLAPGARWKSDGISWTPETALVAYTAAMSGRPGVSAHWMDWLSQHRAPGGSLPEKVLPSGAPAGPAPLAWTAALVVLTSAQLEATSSPLSLPESP